MGQAELAISKPLEWDALCTLLLLGPAQVHELLLKKFRGWCLADWCGWSGPSTDAALSWYSPDFPSHTSWLRSWNPRTTLLWLCLWRHLLLFLHTQGPNIEILFSVQLCSSFGFIIYVLELTLWRRVCWGWVETLFPRSYLSLGSAAPCSLLCLLQMHPARRGKHCTLPGGLF